MLPDGAVEAAAHRAKAAGRADERRLGGGELLAGGEGPAEMGRVDAEGQAGVLVLAALGRRLKVAAVEQHRAVTQAALLLRAMLAEDHKGVVLVAGRAAGAADALHTGAQGRALGGALAQVMAIEGDEVEVGAGKIQAEGGAPAERDRLLPQIFDPHRAGDEIELLKDAVAEGDRDMGGGILELDEEGLGLPLPGKKGGQAIERVLAPLQLIAAVAQIAGVAAVWQRQLDRGQAEIPHPAGGILLRQHVEREGAVGPGLVGVGGKAAVGAPDQGREVLIRDAGAVVGVQQHPAGAHLHLIGGAAGVDGKQPGLLVVSDHGAYLL